MKVQTNGLVDGCWSCTICVDNLGQVREFKLCFAAAALYILVAVYYHYHIKNVFISNFERKVRQIVRINLKSV